MNKQEQAHGQTSGDVQVETFTQQQVDAIIGQRLIREREKYGDYDQLQEQAEKWQQAEAARLTELERLQARVKTADSEKQQALQRAEQHLVRAAFMAAAAAVGAAHPEDAYSLADKVGIKVAEDGKVTGATEAVEQLVRGERLVMRGKPNAAKLNGGAGSGKRLDSKHTDPTAEQLAAAQKMRLSIEDYMKYAN